ncbi:hypothetical protein [Paraburkholderia graminis]|uniref:Integrase catalytic region n=1 Tax=Paraburkholderia graminis TaxID=60548 RepID=A0ABD5CRU4_9BURK|nr:hypothetical protein [Paraburkholderia graminis]
MNVLKPHQQSTVFSLLELNKSQREIHRITGIDRKTIRRYTAIFAVPAPASGEDRRRLLSVASLENAGRPPLTRITTTPHALRHLTLRGVVRGSHTTKRRSELRVIRQSAARRKPPAFGRDLPHGCHLLLTAHDLRPVDIPVGVTLAHSHQNLSILVHLELPLQTTLRSKCVPGG